MLRVNREFKNDKNDTYSIIEILIVLSKKCKINKR